MKAVILAGGLGTRISEETTVRPKPMVEIGGRPILWHILKLYSQHGINDFIICCGYKGYVIKEFFANYFLHTSDVTFDMTANKMDVHELEAEPWRVTLVDTGDSTGTGGRLRRVASYLTPGEPFCMTYGDGVADVDITASITFHKAHGKARHPHQRPARRPLRRPRPQGHPDLLLPGKTIRRGWLDQRRFLRPRAQQPSTPSPTTARCSSANPSKPWSRRVRSTPSSITASGRPWTPSATSSTSKSSGAKEKPHGRPGNLLPTDDFWRNRRVFLTGHTGFKGGWMALWLSHLGATVRGYSLDPATSPSLFAAANIGSVVDDVRGDIRDAATLDRALSDFAPEVVFHMAAQPLVRYSYQDPIGTYETNVIGTARVLDAVRRTPSVRAVVSVTTDKCYENKEWIWPYRETDPLGGYDPYSASKACAEIVSASFRQSFFHPSLLHQPGGHHVAVATARAGNVIGGGDWSTDRLIPDLVRGFLSGAPVAIRRPNAIRPWQHVLEPIHGYITLAEKLLSPGPEAARYATAYNFGPTEDDARPVAWIADRMTRFWGNSAAWFLDEDPNSPHEATYLKLDASRARNDLHWQPRLRLETALEWLVAWYRTWQSSPSTIQAFTLQQIAAYDALTRSREASLAPSSPQLSAAR